MKATTYLKPRWTVDENDEPWYWQSPSHRQRGQWRNCQQCGRRFPSPFANLGKFCNQSCSAKANARPGQWYPDLFQLWTPQESWLAGLIWADGCLYEHRGRWLVGLALTDDDLLAQAADILRVPTCSYQPRPGLTRARKRMYRLEYGDQAGIARLMSYGLTPRKSLTATWPSGPLVEAAFIRGYFDGDGCVCRPTDVGVSPNRYGRVISTMIGSYGFLDAMQGHLERLGGIQPKRLRAHASVWSVYYGHVDSLRLASVMYADGGPHLERKRMLFDEAARSSPTRAFPGFMSDDARAEREAMVRDIRAAYRPGTGSANRGTCAELATKYGLQQRHVRDIASGGVWASIAG